MPIRQNILRKGKAPKQNLLEFDVFQQETGESEKKIWTSSEIARLKPHEFEAIEKEIDKANREGRIIP